jgi:rubrerythrin
MFGTHLDQHPTTFRFTVRRAVRHHSDLAYDTFFRDHEAEATELVEFEMTATQFVEMLTSLNVGDGVPCTIRHVQGTRMEDVPEEHKSERELIRSKFTTDMRDLAKTAKPATTKLDTILSKKTIDKSDRNEIRGLVRSIIKQFDDHAPFVLKQFDESADRMETDGKAEVEAYAQQVIRAAGLEHLRRLKDMAPEQVEAELQALGVHASETQARAKEGGGA